MADKYWDPELGSDSNGGGSVLAPVKSWNAANIGGGTFAPGDRLLMRAGSTYDAAAGGRLAPAFSSSPTAANPFVISTYGDPTLRGIIDGKGTRDIGIRPAVSIDQTNGPRYVTIENMEAKRFTAHGISIAETLDTGVTDANNTIRNCYVHHCTGINNAAINIYGQNIRVEDCIVEDVAGDGILFRGKGYCGRNTIRRVSNTGGGFGDGIQVDGGHGASIIEFNDITRENTDKQGLLVVGNGCLVRFNAVRGLSIGAGLLTIYQSTGNLVYGNVLVGTDGIYLLDATGVHYCFANIIVGTNPAETAQNSTGIDTGATYVHQHQIHHNLVIGHQRGIYARNAYCRNNIVMNCGGTGIDTGVGAIVESNNLSWNNGTNFSGTPGAGSIQVDPKLLDLSAPWLGLKPGSPCQSAGAYVQGVRDRFGRRYLNPPNIGPWAVLKRV